MGVGGYPVPCPGGYLISGPGGTPSHVRGDPISGQGGTPSRPGHGEGGYPILTWSGGYPGYPPARGGVPHVPLRSATANIHIAIDKTDCQLCHKTYTLR